MWLNALLLLQGLRGAVAGGAKKGAGDGEGGRGEVEEGRSKHAQCGSVVFHNDVSDSRGCSKALERRLEARRELPSALL